MAGKILALFTISLNFFSEIEIFAAYDSRYFGWTFCSTHYCPKSYTYIDMAVFSLLEYCIGIPIVSLVQYICRFIKLNINPICPFFIEVQKFQRLQ